MDTFLLYKNFLKPKKNNVNCVYVNAPTDVPPLIFEQTNTPYHYDSTNKIHAQIITCYHRIVYVCILTTMLSIYRQSYHRVFILIIITWSDSMSCGVLLYIYYVL